MISRTVADAPKATFSANKNGVMAVVLTDDVIEWAQSLLPIASEQYMTARVSEINAATANTVRSDFLFDVLMSCETIAPPDEDAVRPITVRPVVDELAWENMRRFLDEIRQGVS